MITIIEAKFSHYSDSGVSVNTYLMAGLSSDSDTKPTTEDVGNGSCYIEMDTSKVWFYDEGSTTWLEWGAESNVASNATSNAASTLSMTRPSLTLGNPLPPDVVEDMPDMAEDVPDVMEEDVPEMAEEEMPDTADNTEGGEDE